MENNYSFGDVRLNNQSINYGVNIGAHYTDTRNCIAFGIEDYLASYCVGNVEYEHLYSIWILEKKHAAYALEKNNDQYSNFSRHDVSHSRMIISCIELMLGQERIYSLTPTDAWLILMCAYKHDLGMRIFFEDLRDFIDPSNRHKYESDINACKAMDSRSDLSEAAFFIFDRLSDEDRKKFADARGITEWPSDVAHKLSLLFRYIARRDHHKRVKEQILENIDENTYQGLLTMTMVEMVANICETHGLDDRSVITLLEQEVKGAGRDYAHPRFVAMLLRVGDLLDMDSNRFSPFIYKYAGKVRSNSSDFESIAHEIKHSAVRNINISPETISAMADFDWARIRRTYEYRIKSSNDNENDSDKLPELLHKAKSEINKWFGYLKGSTEYFAVHWHAVAPKKFPGSMPLIGKLDIKFQGTTLNDRDFDLKFSISPYRASEVLKGVGLYDDIRVFLRELVQNAWDATKRQIYYDYEGNGIKKNDVTEIAKRAAAYPVKLRIEKVSVSSQRIVLKITVSDTGLGVNEEALHNMKKVGDVYDPYASDVAEMPEWLKPTSAFGIGLQSVFPWADNFKMKSKSRRDFESRDIILHAPKYGGEIISMRSDTSKPTLGTDVIVNINIDTQDIVEALKNVKDWERELPPDADSARDPLSGGADRLIRWFYRYIKHTISHDVIRFEYNLDGVGSGHVESIFELLKNHLNKQAFDYDMEKGTFLYWSESENIFVKGSFHKNSTALKTHVSSYLNFGKVNLFLEVCG